MARAFPAARALALVAAAALALSACSDDEDEPVAQATATAQTNAADGVLKIGTLLPETGSLQILGPPEIAGVKLALQDINDAGGVLGNDVEVEYSDSGDTTTDIATQSVNRLLDAGVDSIVGAASSGVTLTVIDRITDSGVLQISPANTSTALTDYEDDGLYYRTAPSDLFQGRVVADTALDDGAETLAILALQDAYGTSLATQIENVFTDGGGEVVEKIIYNPQASEFSAEVGQIADANPDAIAVIGFAETSKIFDEMVEADVLPLGNNKSIFLVDGNMSNEAYADRPEGELAGVKGTIPGSKPSADFEARLLEIDSGLKDFSYAGESYDAVNLVALAAEAGNSDAGVDIAANLQEVSAGGTECGTFSECVELLRDGTDIDYQGQSGPIEFDENGDPSAAAMGVYEYGDDNQYVLLRTATGQVSGGALTSEDAETGSPSGSASEESASPEPTSTTGSASASEESASPDATSTP